MPAKSFEITSYGVSESPANTIGGGVYKFYSLIECSGSGGDTIAIYFMTSASPVPANIYNPAVKIGSIYLPAQLFGHYVDLLRNEKPIYGYCNSDHPEWNQISTGNEFVGEGEVTPDAGAWLLAHPQVCAATVWETSSGTQVYPSWSASMKSDLANAFNLAWNFGTVMSVDPVPNKKTLLDTDDVVQIIDQTYAWPMYLAFVAQSLAVEIGNRVAWSIIGYSATGLAQLFDSRETFRWNAGESGYEIQFSHGAALPCAPTTASAFMSSSIVAASRYATIAALLDWCRSNLRHFMGGWDTANINDQWQYRGLPPIVRMIQGTATTSQPSLGIHHTTGGCWGTTGFLRGLLRAVNIPARLVTHCSHAQPNFVEDGLFLTHGDDPYNQLTTSVPPMPISELLVNQAQFDTWFGGAVPASQQCNNVGRREIDLSLTYLPTYVLKAYCRDIANGKTHSAGEVFNIYHNLYTAAQLEAMNLWTRMDNKIASLGGCSHL